MTEQKNNEPRLAIIGAGNVATHLASAFADRLVGIWCRTYTHARALADRVGTNAYSEFALLNVVRPDIILVSISDKGLSDLARTIGRLEYDPLVIHTSGTVGMEALAPVSPRYGIMYPLQTFSAAVPVDMSKVPFFNEAVDEADLEIIDLLASLISGSVHHADAAHRRLLHIAGVFTSNFTNVLLECVQRVLSDGDYSLDVVRPLMEATVGKAFEVGPHKAQTGPACRGDFAVINRQENSLDETLKPVYRTLTDLILNLHGIKREINQ